MCLTTVTRIKKHKFGYKIYNKTKEGILSSPFYSEREYKIGGKYQAFKKVATKGIATQDGSVYDAGFHYYLKLKDAKKNINSRQCVVRIIPTTILACGTQVGFECAVSKFKTIDKIMYDQKNQLKKDFIKMTTKKNIKVLIKFLRKIKGKRKTIELCNKFNDFICQSDTTFTDYINFVDCLPRESKSYNIFTATHYFMIYNFKKYKKYFDRICFGEIKLMKLINLKSKRNIFTSKEIDKLLLNEDEGE